MNPTPALRARRGASLHVLAGVIALCAASLARAAAFGGVEVPPPLPAQPVNETFFGTTVTDPYRYLEESKDPKVVDWMKAQTAATEAIFERMPGRKQMLDRIVEIESQAAGLTQQVVRASKGGQYFFLKRDPKDNQFRLVWRERADGPDRLIVDPEALAKKTGTPHAILDFAPSPDGRRIAYAMQAGGGEIGTLHVVDLASGKELIEPIPDIRYAGVAWLPDGSGFFYSRLRENWESYPVEERFDDRTRHFRLLADPKSDRKVFAPSMDRKLGLPRYASSMIFPVDAKLAGNFVYLGVERYRLFYLGDLAAAKAGKASWKQVVAAEDKVPDVDVAGGFVYARTAKRAPRFEIVRMPLARPDFAKAEVVMPASENVIIGMGAAKDALYVVRREGAVHALWRVGHERGAKPQRIALPFEGAIEITGADRDRDGVVFEMGGWTRATKPFEYLPSTGKVVELPLVTPGKFDAPDDIMARGQVPQP